MFKEMEPTIPKEDKALFYFYFSQAAFGAGDYDGYLAILKKSDRAGLGGLWGDSWSMRT